PHQQGAHRGLREGTGHTARLFGCCHLERGVPTEAATANQPCAEAPDSGVVTATSGSGQVLASLEPPFDVASGEAIDLPAPEDRRQRTERRALVPGREVDDLVAARPLSQVGLDQLVDRSW